MACSAVRWALEQPLKASEGKFVLVALAEHADKRTGLCFPSVKLLAAETGQKARTVQRHLRVLEEKGYILTRERARKNGSLASSEYLLLMDQAQPVFFAASKSPPPDTVTPPPDEVSPLERSLNQSLNQEQPPIVPQGGQSAAPPVEEVATAVRVVPSESLPHAKKTTDSRTEKYSAAPPGPAEIVDPLVWWFEAYNANKPLAWVGCDVLSEKRKRRITLFVKEHGEEQARRMFVNALRFVAQDSWWGVKTIRFDTLWTKNHLLEWHEAWSDLGRNPIHGMSDANRRLAATRARFARAVGMRA